MRKAVIRSTGRYLPQKVLSNADFEKFLDTTDEWITTRTGIKERRIADEEEATSDLAVKSAEVAIEKSGLDKSDIDLIIVATFTPDMPLPSTACLVQKKLGIKNNCGAFDIAAACSGFCYGLSIAREFIESGRYNNILLIGAETMSRVTDYKDRGSCILFGDGAGSFIISSYEGNDKGIEYTYIASDGEGWPLLYIPAGGSLLPASTKTVEDRSHYIKLQGREIYKFAVQKMQMLIGDALEKCNLSVDDIDLIVPHQVNKRIIDSACEHFGFPAEKVYLNIDKVGNTSAASIPIAFDQAIEEGRIKEGSRILLLAFGAGLTWASAVLRF